MRTRTLGIWRATVGAVPRWLRILVLVGVVGTLLLTAGTVASVRWVRDEAQGHLFTAQDVPDAPVALVLGTRVQPDGNPSPFLAGRLEVARQLYAAGKVEAILVSGDNSDPTYDEPGAMFRWLVAHGVPADRVVRDRAGLDTYDSCARAKRIFGVTRATVVTQSFHLPRAVTVCRRLGVDANGVGDDSARAYGRTWRISSTREHLASVKAVLDVASGRDPAHLGRPDPAIEDALTTG